MSHGLGPGRLGMALVNDYPKWMCVPDAPSKGNRLGARHLEAKPSIVRIMETAPQKIRRKDLA